MPVPNKAKLTLLRKGGYGAEEGKFRAILMDGEKMFQIGNDVGTLGEARSLCREQPIGSVTMIYNDQGVPQKR
jgi:hypothetical protein